MNFASLDDFRIDTSEPKLLSDGRVDNSEGRGTKPLAELGTAVVRLFGDFNDTVADAQQLTRLEVFPTEIEINKKIVPGKFPWPLSRKV